MDFLSRLKEEKNELSIKIDRLVSFMNTDLFCNLSDANRFLLQEQLKYMQGYKDILKTRLELIEKECKC